MIEERAKKIQFHVNKSLSEYDKTYRLGKIVSLIDESIKEIEARRECYEYAVTNERINLKFYYEYGVIEPYYSRHIEGSKGGSIAAYWIAHRVLGICDEHLERTVDEFRVFAGADYFERLERIVIDEFELIGFYFGKSQPTTESKAKSGRPKGKREITGFDGLRFTNKAKQAAYEEWLIMTKKGANTTAKSLWRHLYSLANTNASELTDWAIFTDDKLMFQNDSLSFSSLNTGSFLGDFKKARDKT